MAEDLMQGHIVAVSRELRGDELAVAAAASATVLTVNDVADFDEEGGLLRITDEDGDVEEVVEYVTIDDDVSTITLTAGLTNAFNEGARLDSLDENGSEVIVWYASILEDVDEAPIMVPIAHTLLGGIRSGMRVVGESATVERDADGEWWVTNIIGHGSQSLAMMRPRHAIVDLDGSGEGIIVHGLGVTPSGLVANARVATGALVVTMRDADDTTLRISVFRADTGAYVTNSTREITWIAYT